MFKKVSKSNVVARHAVPLLCFLLLFEQSGFAQVAGAIDISGHFVQMLQYWTPDKFRPLHLRYLQYLPEQNSFRLLIDKGDFQQSSLRGSPDAFGRDDRSNLSFKNEIASGKNRPRNDIEEQAKTLLNYFFIGLSLPNDSFWVNLRPDSPDNIIDSLLAQTDVGKILLEADLQLKKDTAKFTSPDTPEGREYWDKLYQKAGELFGSENITIPTLTRPWIVPDEIIIREAEDNAYIYKATLKVMLEEDYLTQVEGGRSKVNGNDVGARHAVPLQQYDFKDGRLKELNVYSSQLIRELIIPKLTQEINTSKRYAPLRQVYYSLILAQWFKSRFAPSSLRGAAAGGDEAISNLIDSRNLANLTSKESWDKDTYFNAYKENFTKGEYSIKEPRYTPYGQTIRSYFSGGINIPAQPTGTISGRGPIEGKQAYEIEVGARHAVPLQDVEIATDPLHDGAAIFGASRNLDNADVRYHKLPDDRRKDMGQKVSSPESANVNTPAKLRIFKGALYNCSEFRLKGPEGIFISGIDDDTAESFCKEAQTRRQQQLGEEMLAMSFVDFVNAVKEGRLFDKRYSGYYIYGFQPLKNGEGGYTKQDALRALSHLRGLWQEDQQRPIYVFSPVEFDVSIFPEDKNEISFPLYNFPIFFHFKKDGQAVKYTPRWNSWEPLNFPPKNAPLTPPAAQPPASSPAAQFPDHQNDRGGPEKLSIGHSGEAAVTPLNTAQADPQQTTSTLKELHYFRHELFNPLFGFVDGFSYYNKRNCVSPKLEKIKSLSDKIFDFFDVLPDEDPPAGKDKVDLDNFLKQLRQIAEESQTVLSRDNLISAFQESYQMLSKRDRSEKKEKILVDLEITVLTYARNVLADLLPDFKQLPGAVNLNRTIESALAQKKLIFNMAQREYSAGDIEIFTDEAALTRALTNLVINAAEAIGSNDNRGDFRVKTQITEDRQHVEIILSDTAGGIVPEVLTRLFKEPVSTKEWKKGGQGLMITKRYIEERCHGTITVQSTPGQGTTFTVRLPLAPPAAQPPASSPVPSTAENARSTGPPAPDAQPAQPIKLSELPDKLAHVVVSLASFGHGTNDSTEVITAFASLSAYEYFVRKAALQNPNLSAYHKNVEDFYGKLEHAKRTLGKDLYLMAHDVVKHKGEITENQVLAWQEEAMGAFNLFKEVKQKFDSLKTILDAHFSEDDRQQLRELDHYMNVCDDMLEDRMMLMNGQISDKIFILNDILGHFFDHFTLTSRGVFREYFELRLPRDDIWLRGNRNSIISLLCNLADDCFKYAREFKKGDAKVTIEVRTEDNEAVIQISDNGQGISADGIKDIWKPFYTTKGTGIGLTEARLIAKDHGGTIDVQSTTGQGTTFTVRLPFVPPPEVSQDLQPPPASSPAAEHSRSNSGSNLAEKFHREGGFIYFGHEKQPDKVSTPKTGKKDVAPEKVRQFLSKDLNNLMTEFHAQRLAVPSSHIDAVLKKAQQIDERLYHYLSLIFRGGNIEYIFSFGPYLNEEFLVDMGFYVYLYAIGGIVFITPYEVLTRKRYNRPDGGLTEVLYLHHIVENPEERVEIGHNVPGERFICLDRDVTQNKRNAIIGSLKNANYYRAHTQFLSEIEGIAKEAIKKDFTGKNASEILDIVEFQVELHEHKHNENDLNGTTARLKPYADERVVNEILASLTELALGPAPYYYVLHLLEGFADTAGLERKITSLLIFNDLSAVLKIGTQCRGPDDRASAVYIGRSLLQYDRNAIKNAAKTLYGHHADQLNAGQVDEGVIRIALDQWESKLPPYTGAGSTPIHAALSDARDKFGQKDFIGAKIILAELLGDLKKAQENNDTVLLTDKWQARYQSDLPIDLLPEHIGLVIKEAESLLLRIEEESKSSSAPSSPAQPSTSSPAAPLPDPLNDGGRKVPYNQYNLAGGATLLTRLEEINRVDAYGIHEIQDNEEGTVSLRDKVREYRYESSSLEMVEKGLNISILDRIRKLDDMRKASLQPHKPIIILDWGCGDGAALIELSDRLRKENIANVRLIGFSDKYYGKWNRAGQDITFIWDTIKGFSLYFEECNVNFIFSHYGLSNIVNRYFEHLEQLRLILEPGAEIISNFSDTTVEMFRWRLQSVGLEMEVLNGLLAYPACRLFVDENKYIPVQEGNVGSHMRPGQKSMGSLAPNSNRGGIDFTALPAAIQPVLKMGLLRPDKNVGTRNDGLIDIDKEQREIERLVNAGIMPSSERVRECALAALSRGGRDKNKVASCVMGILRMQEERCCQTEPILEDILIVLENPGRGE